MRGGTTGSDLLDWTSCGEGEGEPPQKTTPQWPPYGLSLGDGILWPRVASYLIRQAFGGATGLGVSLGLTQLPSLPVGTRASGPVGAGGCGKKRRRAVSQRGAARGSSGKWGACTQLSDPTWQGNKHSDISHTLSLADTHTHTHAHTHMCSHCHICTHMPPAGASKALGMAGFLAPSKGGSEDAPLATGSVTARKPSL